jgi:formylglycine-generating enzyme
MAIAGALAVACGGELPPSAGSDDDSTAAATSSSTSSSSSRSTSTSSDEASSADDESSTAVGSSEGESTSGEPPPRACMLSGVAGDCADVVACPSAAFSWLGGCADTPPAIQCCLPDAIECSVDGAAGLCLPSAACPDGLTRTAGLCPGDADVQCCSDPTLACDPEAMPLPNEGLLEQSFDPSCPDGMVPVASFCIDRHEAALVRVADDGSVLGSFSPYWNPAGVRVRAVSIEGAVPQGYIDQVAAAAACDEAGKRLCDDDEWLRACQGAAGHTYPYGDDAMPGVCNDARARHPAIEYFGTSDASVWSQLGHPCILQIPDGVQTGGAHPGCRSDDGVLDMMGNLHEWTADPAGTFRGGFFVDTVLNGPGCHYATVAHDVAHWDYSTGFRCCADPR